MKNVFDVNLLYLLMLLLYDNNNPEASKFSTLSFPNYKDATVNPALLKISRSNNATHLQEEAFSFFYGIPFQKKKETAAFLVTVKQ